MEKIIGGINSGHQDDQHGITGHENTIGTEMVGHDTPDSVSHDHDHEHEDVHEDGTDVQPDHDHDHDHHPEHSGQN